MSKYVQERKTPVVYQVLQSKTIDNLVPNQDKLGKTIFFTL